MLEKMLDDIDAWYIQWYINQNWTTNTYFLDIDEVQNQFKDVKEKGEINSQSRRQFSFEDFNTEQRQFRNIMVMACLQDRN